MISYKFTVDDPVHIRLDKYLTSLLEDCSRTQVQAAIKDGRTSVDGQNQKPSFLLQGGETVEIKILDQEPVRKSLEPQAIDLEIIYEDSSIIVVNKPVGLVVHPGTGQPDGTLVNGLVYHFSQLSDINGVLRPGIVHRLDRDTSGVMVIAKNNSAHRKVAAQFEKGAVEKTYLGIVWGKCREKTGSIQEPIRRSRKDPTRYEVGVSGRDSRTDFKVVDSNRYLSVIEFYPKTGRTHQIRVHVAHIGYPIFCDQKYGGGENRSKGFLPEVQKKLGNMLNEINRHALHAGEISFLHPDSGEKVSFEAPLPEDMDQIITEMKKFYA